MRSRFGNGGEGATPAGQDDRSLAAAAAALTASGGSVTVGDSPDLLRKVLALAPVGVALLDERLRWQYLNAAFTTATGLRRADLLGRPVAATAFAGAAGTLRRVLADGRDREHATGGPDGAGAPVPAGLRVRYRPLEAGGHVTGVVVVVLDDPGPEQELRRELAQARARLALLDAATERIGTTLDVDTTCAELASFAVPRLAELVTVDVLPPDSPARPGRTRGLRLHRAAAHCTGSLRTAVTEPARPGESVRYRDGSAAARALAAGVAVLADVPTDGQLADAAPDPASLAAYRAAGLTSLLAVPLAARGQLVGLLTLARTAASPGFTPEEAALIGDLAARAATSVDNARRYARSQGIALELQRALLSEPGNPHQNIELSARYLPSGTSSVVGGDWYETVRLPFGRTLLVMGDVMGHGVEAAVDMSTYRSTLRDVAGMDLPPHRILRQLDTVIAANDSARPATCLLALADPGRNRWTLSSAGHLPPALIAPGRPTELLQIPTGPPLGTGLGGYEQATRELLPGETLLLYTDGLVERRDEDIDVSLARLAALRLPAAGELDDLLDAVLHALAPTGPTAPAAEDDIAVLAARPRARQDGPAPGATVLR
ncbi:SpoIIE family protein phosphatase [Streptomyces sp. CB01881]|uniref:SpoIIE family protein phosphatase n=1 Tax=Streptomyces sp. CB01881 TaxID=2078691 RepID=UPI000CDBB8EC|nr:SpoIIE family protein phosphatase [Streptomyces sp. CB01881]AUY47863.1 diguanylate cyclase [Streptomyces sp. CB01881]TYC76337.1 GAF domain-containing protein [Streptomyces sp. CB01881]